MDKTDEKREKLVKTIKNIFSKSASEDERTEGQALNKEFEKTKLQDSVTEDERVEADYVQGFKKPKIEKSLTKDEKDYTEDELDLAKQREQLIGFFKNSKAQFWLKWIALAILGWFGYAMRIRNLGLLTDETTGKIVQLALDPHLFYRYAKEILVKGSLAAWDYMRYTPIGTSTNFEGVLLSKVIVYLHKILSIFDPSTTIEKSTALYPPVFFVLGLVFFFLLVRRIFKDYRIAILASTFLTIIPTYLYRTMAGFADKEALAMFFMFGAFYFFTVSWQSKDYKYSILFGLIAGLFTGWMGLVWGGVKFLFLIAGTVALIELLRNKFTPADFASYTSWLLVSYGMLTILTAKYGGIAGLVQSITSGIASFVFIALVVHYILFEWDLLNIKKRVKTKVPYGIVSVGIVVVLGMIGLTVIFGTSYLGHLLEDVRIQLLHAATFSRLARTVAENNQPYFLDWWGNFRWFFYFFFLGSIILFYETMKPLKKYSLKLSLIYGLFISGLIFSRYSAGSTFNGENFISQVVYLGSFALFAIVLVGYYLYFFYKDKETFKDTFLLNKSHILIFVWFIIMAISARTAARLFFGFTPVIAILGAYFFVKIFDYSLKVKDKVFKYGLVIVVALLLVNNVYSFGKSSWDQAQWTGPSYNQQWQLAGNWIRENTPEDANFAHWWDYGYWVQTGGERATILDGGNYIAYWDHLMGRHVLTGHTQEEALEFLDVHDATHLLIIADEIGKYTAYSSIGSDEEYDRYSWISTFLQDDSLTQETRNETIYVYQGGYPLDEDFIWQGKLFPKGESGVGAVMLPTQQVLIEQDNETVKTQIINQPSIIMVHKGQQAKIPLKNLYINGNMLSFEGEGYDGCLRIIPSLQDNGMLQNPNGAGLFISERSFKALWINLFLFEQNNPKFNTTQFKLVYDDSDRMPLAYYRGRNIGPLKIWEIEYPENFTVSDELRETYLRKQYLNDAIEFG
ncbi:hypothetical protein KY330_01830 [Candidatus Woesearchaeota archaeon]|nr:hypothetical protein [Candidatus Woesearchaeota archaeon]